MNMWVDPIRSSIDLRRTRLDLLDKYTLLCIETVMYIDGFRFPVLPLMGARFLVLLLMGARFPVLPLMGARFQFQFLPLMGARSTKCLSHDLQLLNVVID